MDEQRIDQTISIPQRDLSAMSAVDLVDYFAVLLQGEELPSRELVNKLQKTFDQKFSEATPQELEVLEIQKARLGDLIKSFRQEEKVAEEKRAEAMAASKRRKEELLRELELLVSGSEDFGKRLHKFKELRKEWDELSTTVVEDNAKLQEQYNRLREAFYELKQLNDEFRQLDYKKNLEAKRKLIAEAEQLNASSNIREAFKKLQELHRQWHFIGPVAPEIRDSLWQEFKKQSDALLEKHHEYYNQKKANEEHNLVEKQGLCETLEALVAVEYTSMKDWDKATEELKALQTRWKEIGSVPMKERDAIYQRYRLACDTFFMRKKSVYHEKKKQDKDALQERLRVVEQAEKLQDSTEWEATKAQLIELKAAWQAIKGGTHDRKKLNDLWLRLKAACDRFFDRKRLMEKERKAANQEEVRKIKENLKQKKALILEARALLEGEISAEHEARVRALVQAWGQIGQVPWKKHNPLNKEWTELTRQLQERFGLNIPQTARLRSYSKHLDNISQSEDELYRELNKMRMVRDKIASKIKQYEMNMERLNITGGSANGLMKEVKQQLRSLKKDYEEVSQKVLLVEDRLEE